VRRSSRTVSSRRRDRVLILAALALAAVPGLFITRSIAQPIAVLGDAVDRLRAADLTLRVAERSSADPGTLAANFNGITEQLKTTTMSKSYLDDIIRSMGEIITVTDLRGRVRTVNRAATVIVDA
jgi:nitrogen fixation/metabolism regulation signal transduction histidine kinase